MSSEESEALLLIAHRGDAFGTGAKCLTLAFSDKRRRERNYGRSRVPQDMQKFARVSCFRTAIVAEVRPGLTGALFWAAFFSLPGDRARSGTSRAACAKTTNTSSPRAREALRRRCQEARVGVRLRSADSWRAGFDGLGGWLGWSAWTERAADIFLVA